MAAPYANASARAPPLASWATATTAGVPKLSVKSYAVDAPAPFERDHDHVGAPQGRDAPEVDVEAVREQDGCP